MKTGTYRKPTPKQQAILDKVRKACRVGQKAWKTEQAYVSWSRRFLFWWQDLEATKKADYDTYEKRIKEFLTYLALKREVSKATQDSAFNALLFLHNKALDLKLGELTSIPRAKARKRKPVIVDRDVVEDVLKQLPNTPQAPTALVCWLLYLTGARLNEMLHLRTKDVDFKNGLITARDCKGFKDRHLVLPCSLVSELRRQIRYARHVWELDREQGIPTRIPSGLLRKYPHLEKSWNWFYIFHGPKPCRHPRTKRMVRYTLLDNTVQKQMKAVVDKSPAEGVLTPHVLRHNFADNLLKLGIPVPSVAEAMGHENINTTMIYSHAQIDVIRPYVDRVTSGNIIEFPKQVAA